MLFLFLLFIGIILIIAFKGDKKPSYTSSAPRPKYTYRDYDDMDDDDLMFDDDEDEEDHYYDDDDHYYDDDDDDDIHDTGEIFNRFQDGNMSKSDMGLMMEDDDIRDEFYGEY